MRLVLAFHSTAYIRQDRRRGRKAPEFIRMAGMNICQRQTMTVNHGLYYVDLTASAKRKALGRWTRPKNIFMGGKKYDFFLVYAKEDTEQTYQMYVGPGFNKDSDVELIRANVVNVPFPITPLPATPSIPVRQQKAHPEHAIRWPYPDSDTEPGCLCRGFLQRRRKSLRPKDFL